jgi:hypothetical protein
MQIILNNILSNMSMHQLSDIGDLVFIETHDIVYKAISNHPDIFFCPMGDKLIVAPNLPQKYKSYLQEKGVNLVEGIKSLNLEYPETAYYNAVVTDSFIIGNEKLMDQSIKDLSDNRKLIHVKQAYTRCNLLPLPNDRFITSDKGILKQLEKNNLDVLFVNPEGIKLESFSHGFFGGCCGVRGNKVFIMGNLNHFPQGDKVRDYLADMEIIELYDGPLLDVGSIIFV